MPITKTSPNCRGLPSADFLKFHKPFPFNERPQLGTFESIYLYSFGSPNYQVNIDPQLLTAPKLCFISKNTNPLPYYTLYYTPVRNVPLYPAQMERELAKADYRAQR